MALKSHIRTHGTPLCRAHDPESEIESRPRYAIVWATKSLPGDTLSSGASRVSASSELPNGLTRVWLEYHEAVRWKQSLTPLAEVTDLGADRVHVLMEHHITTAEEFVGQIESAPRSVGVLLDLDDSGVQDLCHRALEASNPEITRSMEKQRGRTHRLGARLGRPA